MRILIEVPTYDGRISQATSESLWRLDRCGHEFREVKWPR